MNWKIPTGPVHCRTTLGNWWVFYFVLEKTKVRRDSFLRELKFNFGKPLHFIAWAEKIQENLLQYCG